MKKNPPSQSGFVLLLLLLVVAGAIVFFAFARAYQARHSGFVPAQAQVQA